MCINKNSLLYPKITKLPLLKGIDQKTLDVFLKESRIACFEKNAEIFFQGGEAEHFYIILEGYIKLFQVDIEGKEALLRIVTTGDNLLETVIGNSTYLVNAHAISKVTLLSIPLPYICKLIKHNEIIASNMLSIMIEQSRQSISHFTQISLKTVLQRVGWFFLKLFIGNGRGLTIKLPYDKRLIASYLGMKPETFSRIIKKFERKGVSIKKNVINLSDPFALCAYCDIEIASRCSNHNTDRCPNPDCV